MTFKDCILGKIADGKVGQPQGTKLLNKYEALTEKYIQAGRSEEAAALAAEDILRAEASLIEQRQRNLRQHALKQKELNDWWESTAGEGPKKASDLYQRAAFRGQSVRHMAYKFMDQAAATLKSDFFELKRDYKTFADGVRSALGHAPTSDEAAKVGQVIKQTYDYLHSRYKAAGGIIGKIDNYFPQVHTKESIRKVSAEEWVDFTYRRLNHEEMIDISTGAPFKEARLREILAKEYQSIVTAGRSDLLEQSRQGKAPVGGAGDLDAKRNKSRFLVFKDADAFMEYNAKFGVGEDGLIRAFLGSVDSMSRDIGVLELMGPRPAAISKFFDFKMRAEGGPAWKRKWANAQFRVLTSRFEGGDVDGAVWKLFSGAQNWLRSAMLGGASISAISDTAFIAATAKINGLSSTRAMGKYFQSLGGGAEAREVARRSGYIIDAIGGSALADARFAGDGATSGFTATLAGLTNKLSGLGAMTRATQDAVSLEGMATLAEVLGKKIPWADLDPDLKLKLSQFGLNESDWDLMKSADQFGPRGAKFLITSDLRVDDMLRKKIADSIRPEFEAAAAAKAASENAKIQAARKDALNKIDYSYVPLDVTKSVEGKQFFHGTKAKIRDLSDVDIYQYSSVYNLYGDGLYLTDNPNVARSYAANKGEGAAGDVHKANLKDLKLIDLDKPLPTEVAELLRELTDHHGGDRVSAKAKGSLHYDMLKESLADAGMPESAVADVFNELNIKISELGFDGLRHEGGGRFKLDEGLGHHNVVILFEDKTVDGTGRVLKGKFEVDGKLDAQVDPAIPPFVDALVDESRINTLADERLKQVADKIDDWLMYLRQAAANETTLATRAVTTGALLGDGGPATISRAVMSSLTMFKSFPITVVMTHLLPAIERARVQRKFDHLAMTLVGTTILGGLAMQMKEVIKGKTPKELNSRFWMAAFLQGGGVGLFGDFILGDYSRFGRNPITEAMGPIPGLFEDIYSATKGNFDRAVFDGEEANVTRDLFRVAKRNIPLASLWYGRLAVERLILDNLERLVDPQFERRVRRMERKLTKETGQQFWWAPGTGAESVNPKLIAGEE